MKKKVKRKGLSSVLTALIFISLSLAIIGVVFFWTRGTASQLTTGGTKEKVCSELDLDVEDFCFEEDSAELEVVNGEAIHQTSPTYKLRFNVRSNLENQEITGFFISREDNDGNLDISRTNTELTIKGFEARTFFSNDLKLAEMENIKQIIVAPRIIFNEKEVLCENKEFPAGEVELCP